MTAITVLTGAGALAACSAFSITVVGTVVLIADGRRKVQAARRDGLAALGRVCGGRP